MSDEIMLLSDMHTMSNWGLLHPGFVCNDVRGDIQFIPNEMQEWTFGYWQDTVEDNYDVAAIIFNGDLVDGINPDNYGAVATNDIYSQINMCKELINMFPPDIPKFILGGTQWHSGREICAERIIADKIGAMYSPEAIIEVCGIRIFSNHYAPHAQNKAGGIEKRLGQLAAAESCYGKIDVMFNAHNHKFSAVITQNQIGVMSPGWQHKTPYAIRKNLISPPDIGYVKLIIDDPELITVDRRGVVQSPFGCPVLKW